MKVHRPISELRGAIRRALFACAIFSPLMTPAAWGQVVDPGASREVPDTDGLPGESVTVNGEGSIPPKPGTIESYTWTNSQGVPIASGAVATLRLPDGITPVTLVIAGQRPGSEGTVPYSASATITITVRPTTAPTANAGADRAVEDSDNAPGETVALDGSASVDPDGSIVAYEWFRNGTTPLGQGATLNASLPDGTHELTLTVRDNVGNTASDTTTVTVGARVVAPQVPVLGELENLTPNEESVAANLDAVCARLALLPEVTGEAADLLERCSGILHDPDPNQQREALAELGAEELNALRTQAVIFSRTQYQGVMDRLLALRSGSRGISVSGLSLKIGDKFVSAEQVADSLKLLLGGGASADEPSGDLLDERLGVWMRGTYGIGEKDASESDQGFESDQWGLTSGVDYRFGQSAVLGVSLGYGRSDLTFNPSGDGSLDTSSLTGSLYGSAYLGNNFYGDAVFNYADADYDTRRHIQYAESTTLIDRTADGSTSGDALSWGLSLGYDFIFDGLTVSPTIGYFYVDSNIDGFIERGAGGVNLAYDSQHYESATGNAGIRISYAIKQSWGVIIPHIRGSYVREYEDGTEVFMVRFAGDPFADSANPTPPIIVQTQAPDQSYLRLAAGLSAQFSYGISGYFEYQRLGGYDRVDFQDLTFGIRFQHSFL